MPEALCFCPFPAVRIRTQPKTSTMSLSQYFGRCTYIAFCCGQRKHGKRIIVSLPGINLSRIVWSRFFGRARVTPRKSTPSPHANAKRSRSHGLSPEDIETVSQLTHLSFRSSFVTGSSARNALSTAHPNSLASRKLSPAARRAAYSRSSSRRAGRMTRRPYA